MSKNVLPKKKKVVFVGGGTGTSVLLTALKNIDYFDLTAIVAVSDNGGSTGRLRDEFGFLPVGDLRQCLAALVDGKNQKIVRNILLYRYSKGEGLKGHNLGNLILTALEDLSDSPAKAVEIASKIFRTKGTILPVSENIVNLGIKYQNGETAVGEQILDIPQNGGKKIEKVYLIPKANIYKKSYLVLKNADLIIIGPGDLYASLIPNLLVKGFKNALKESKAKIIYITNIMTHFSQTHDMTAKDHLCEIIKYSGIIPNFILINNGKIPQKILNYYQKSKEFPVIDDLDNNDKYEIIRKNLVLNIMVKKQKSDNTPRSVLRHDPKKLETIFKNLIN
jgi:uncharacterized cofD-like protein